MLNLLDSHPANNSINPSRPSCPIYSTIPHNILLLFHNKCFPLDKQPFFKPFVRFWFVYIAGGACWVETSVSSSEWFTKNSWYTHTSISGDVAPLELSFCSHFSPSLDCANNRHTTHLTIIREYSSCCRMIFLHITTHFLYCLAHKSGILLTLRKEKRQHHVLCRPALQEQPQKMVQLLLPDPLHTESCSQRSQP